jgi:F-type H+-transporting ATPase subunit a
MQLFPAIEKPHVSLKAETLFSIGPIPVTNSMLTMFLVMGAILGFFLFATRRLQTVPRGAQNFAEFVVESLLNLVEGTAGKQVGRRIFPLIATLFIFIITANYSGLLPGVGTIGRHEAEAHGQPRVVEVASADGSAAAPAPAPAAAEAAQSCLFGLCVPSMTTPYFRAPNADLNMTIAMALVAVITVQVSGIAANGAGTYLKEFLNPIHLVGELSRIISLAARLFGNIFGGEVLLAVIIALTTPLLFGLVGLVPVIFYGLELFFGFIQALLFSLLTLIYIAVAVAGHGDHGHRDEHAGTEHEPIGSVSALGRAAD